MGIFKKGLPTDLDIKRLREAFPDNNMRPGNEIKYEHIGSLLNININSSRFYTVCCQWRKKLEQESNIILIPVNGQQKFRVADDADKADISVSKSKTAGRYATRSIQIGSRVNRKNLTDDQLKRFDSNQKFAAAVIGYQTIKPQAELPTI